LYDFKGRHGNRGLFQVIINTIVVRGLYMRVVFHLSQRLTRDVGSWVDIEISDLQSWARCCCISSMGDGVALGVMYY
jgi:hypothetical protein